MKHRYKSQPCQHNAAHTNTRQCASTTHRDIPTQKQEASPRRSTHGPSTRIQQVLLLNPENPLLWHFIREAVPTAQYIVRLQNLAQSTTFNESPPHKHISMNSDLELPCNLDVFHSEESESREYVVIRGYEPGCTTK